MNPKVTKLAPLYRTVAIVGGTGDGKSKTSALPAASLARKIISKSVGETNSTLKERVIVYTEDCIDDMLIAAKIPDEMVDKQEFIEMISRALATVIRKHGGVDVFKIEAEDFINELASEMRTKVNSRAKFSFLSDVLQDAVVCKTSKLLESFSVFNKICYEIYNTARNRLPSDEVKKNSKKFESAIRSETENALDTLDSQFQNDIKAIWMEINTFLESLFFKYFRREDESIDGYYYIQIDLNAPEEHNAVIDALFTSNNIRNGERLSIEVLCSELVIYVPIEPQIATMLHKCGDVFTNGYGHASIAFLDTRGLYHSDTTDEDNSDYLDDLLFSNDYDALMLVWPLSGDTNAEKLRELYVKAIARYNKQIPVFALHNKVDLFVGSMNKAMSADDPFSASVSDEEIGIEEVEIRIDQRIQLMRDELQQAQHKNRKSQPIISLPCYLEKDKSMGKAVLEAYNPIKAFESIFAEIGKHLESSSRKIRVSPERDREIEPVINEAQIKSFVFAQLNNIDVQKKVTAPALSNVLSNLGKTPHGNGYNALKRRLRNGQSYTSNINESYFYNCKSFSIDFPGNLRNLITADMMNLLTAAINFQGGSFEDADGKTKLREWCAYYFSSGDFVSDMMFRQAITAAENKWLFGFGAKFNEFLDVCLVYFDKNRFNMDAYTTAIINALKAAASKAIAYHILYR